MRIICLESAGGRSLHGTSERNVSMTGPEQQRSSRRRHRRSLAATTGIAAVTVTLVACSSSTSSSTSTSTSSASSSAAATAAAVSATSSCMTAANNYLRPWDGLPTSLSSAYTPLTTKPAPGGTVIKLVNGKIPSDNESFQQQAIAAQAIGWHAKEIIFDGTVEDLNAKFQQAVSEKPTAITVSGWPPAALQGPLAAAKAAGIVVGLSSVADP